MRKTGPNDVSGVVWGKGEPLFFFHIFYLLTNIFYYLLVFQGPVLETKKNWQLDWTKTDQDQTAVSVFLIFLK